MSLDLRFWLSTILLAATTPCVAGADGVSTTLPPCAGESLIPRNVTIEDEYLHSLTSEMVRRSPTFKQQLLTLGAASRLRVRFRNTSRLESTIALAKTTFGHSKNGLLVADIQIPVPLIFARRDVEFIAHEAEHVIEQVQGVDLERLSRKRGSGVYRVDMTGRPFETQRAKDAGQAVEREFRDYEDPITPCETVEADGS